jgi:hypothetical protein
MIERLRFFLPVLLMLCCYTFAQEPESPKLSISGSLFTDQRAIVGGEAVQYVWQEYRLSLKGEYKVPGSARFFSEAWVRSLGFSEVSRLSDVQSYPSLSPIELTLREAYVELYNCGINKLDLKIGRQRIAWGSADRINPTDNLDAPDLEDIWDFGRRLSSDAIRATYYLGNFSLTGAIVPWFTPALLPKGEWLNALMPGQSMPQMGVPLLFGEVTEHITMPSRSPEECVNGGARLSGRIGDYDVSLSYVYGRDHFPVVYKKRLTPRSIDLTALPVTLDADVYLEYPRMQVAGLDFAGALGQVGVWAEGAVFFPEKIETVTQFNGQMPTPQEIGMLPPSVQAQFVMLSKMMTTPEIAIDDKPYIKFVIGADYTFPANIYANLQFVHGYLHERGDALEDYIMGSVDWKLFNEKLTLSPLGVGLEIGDWKEISDYYAFIGQPKIAWRPMDNAEIDLGARIIDGKNSTQFGRLSKSDELFAVVKYAF